jgi:protein-tyrosine phosphatase
MADLVPVVTHPERNPILQRDLKKVERWVEEGALVQVTARSVVGGFGKTAAAVSHQLLSQGLVHVIASDAHDPVHRHPKLDQAFAIVQEKYGQELAELLFVSLPGQIIRGDWWGGGRTIAKKEQKWWHVWN